MSRKNIMYANNQSNTTYRPQVVKQWTRQDCINSANHTMVRNNMACDTDPDPRNAFCKQIVNTTYQQQMDKCRTRRPPGN